MKSAIKQKGMKDDELEKKLQDLHEDIRNIRFKGQGAKPKNVKEVKIMRRNIARILTEMRERKEK